MRLRSPTVKRPCSKCEGTQFSCEKNTIGFIQPRKGHLPYLGLWFKRDDLVKELIESINLLTITVSRTVGSEVQEHLKMHDILKSIRETNPE